MLASHTRPLRDTAGQDRPLPRARTAGWRHGLVLLAVLVVLVGGTILGVLRWMASERSIDGSRLRIAEVTRGTLVRDAAVTGRVVAAVSPTLYAPVGGTVTLAIRAGDTVNEGDLLATIDSPELKSQLQAERSTLDQLEAQVGSARISTQRQRLAARREADEAEIALTTANRELQSSQRAYDKGVIPQLELLRAQDAVRNAEVRHENARKAADLSTESATFDLQTAQKQLERQRVTVAELERRITELEVRAPVPGVVGTLSVAERAVVTANTPLLTLVDLGQLEVELEIPETYADELGLGMTGEITIGSTVAVGTLSVLSPEVVDHHVLARLRFTGAQPDGLRQSQRVSARILIEERPDVVMVPRGPFFESHGGQVVYVVHEGLAVRRPIRVGSTALAAIEIVEGLQPGERVVIAGSEAFEDAASVRIIE